MNILVPIVNYLTCNHWDQMLKESLSALKEILQKIDPQAYNNDIESSNQKKFDKSLRIAMPLMKEINSIINGKVL